MAEKTEKPMYPGMVHPDDAPKNVPVHPEPVPTHPVPVPGTSVVPVVPGPLSDPDGPVVTHPKG